MTQQATRLLISFDGPTLCDSDGQVLAELHRDGQWRTPDGQHTSGLDLPVEKVSACVHPAERARHEAEQDRAWLAAAIPVVAELADRMRTITTDEVWSALTMPPREPRQLGALMRACQRRGLIEPTKEHRPSNRPLNNRRPLLVWRSMNNQREERR
jgi:hypothetical protein